MKRVLRPTMALAVACALAVSACAGHRARRPSADRPSVRVLPCREAIGDEPPGPEMTVVLGVVALPASPRMHQSLQTARTGSRDPAGRLFGKWGLSIRPSSEFQLIVPRRLRGRLEIGWGNAGEGHVGTTIVVHACRTRYAHRWLDFAGGYWVRSPVCAPLTVAAHGRREQVWIGIGAPCSGQLPPPQPTQS